MNIQQEVISYADGDINLQGLLFSDEACENIKANILIAHTWEGRGKFMSIIGERLAKLGYRAFAIDMYGDGKTGADMKECESLMQPFMDDRSKLQQRVCAALNALKSLDNVGSNSVDNNKVIAIGYCFGGLTVLDLARSGAELLGVVSFHGLLHAPDLVIEPNSIQAKILVLHGNDDPMVPVEQVNALKKELTQAKADWQIHAYSNTVHAFTSKAAKTPGTAMYNADSDRRSWQSMINFFDELLG